MESSAVVLVDRTVSPVMKHLASLRTCFSVGVSQNMCDKSVQFAMEQWTVRDCIELYIRMSLLDINCMEGLSTDSLSAG